MPRRRRRKRRSPFRLWLRRALIAIAAIPALYLSAALLGSLLAVNRDWSEPDEGITIHLRSQVVRLRRRRAAGLSRHAALARHHAQDRLGRADRRRAGDARRADRRSRP